MILILSVIPPMQIFLTHLSPKEQHFSYLRLKVPANCTVGPHLLCVSFVFFSYHNNFNKLRDLKQHSYYLQFRRLKVMAASVFLYGRVWFSTIQIVGSFFKDTKSDWGNSNQILSWKQFTDRYQAKCGGLMSRFYKLVCFTLLLGHSTMGILHSYKPCLVHPNNRGCIIFFPIQNRIILCCWTLWK